ncbi:hypothetical protein evm_006123 [Chilo suppressalis]|nr:hypothetical protein evm_006123 [Chilo suppressalis]
MQYCVEEVTMCYTTPIFVLAIAGCLSAPVDEPIRVDLPVYDQPDAASGVVLAQPLEPENRDGELLVPKTLPPTTSIFSHKLNQPEVKPGTLNVQGAGGWFSAPVTTLEGALLETEGLGSKALSAKDNLHQLVAGLFQPKPIVDTIKEEEKYGNNGDKFYSAGKAIVGGAQSVSNLVNTILEVPGTIVKKITRVASEKLNNFGGKLIGL